MRIEERIKTVQGLAKLLKTKDKKDLPSELRPLWEKWEEAVEREHFHHSWFVPEFVRSAAEAIADMLLGEDGQALARWIASYRPVLEAKTETHRVGVIMAGNIPLVASHDLLCVFMAGDVFVGKMSSHDTRLWPLLVEMLAVVSPEAASRVELTQDRLGAVDAVIATGSNNSTRYFEHYFGNKPHVFRGHCNGVAVLDGKESAAELQGLAADICLYFGMGCRNVSKVYVPEGYDFTPLFQSMEAYRPLLGAHHSYLNNLEYQKTVHLINSIPFLDQGLCMFKAEASIASPIGVVHYEHYTEVEKVWEPLRSEAVQCVATHLPAPLETVPLGRTQHPALSQYANGIDTLRFLTEV
ncbi:MAG: hypothetical protein J5873_06175 [Bacteroidales bacterium]|nr:hypothetical protein [Bacteroidales bacterium]